MLTGTLEPLDTYPRTGFPKRKEVIKPPEPLIKGPKNPSPEKHPDIRKDELRSRIMLAAEGSDDRAEAVEAFIAYNLEPKTLDRVAAVGILIDANGAELTLPQYGEAFVRIQYDLCIEEAEPGDAHGIAKAMLIYRAKIVKSTPEESPTDREALEQAWRNRERRAFELKGDAILNALDSRQGNMEISHLRDFYNEIRGRSDIGFSAKPPSELALLIARELIRIDIESDNFSSALQYEEDISGSPLSEDLNIATTLSTIPQDARKLHKQSRTRRFA